MSEQPIAAATRPAPRAPGKTYAGLTRNQWLITGGVFVAVLAYIIWKRRQSSAAASSTTGTTNQGSNACTDQNGNPVDCNEAFAQELAAMQNALDQLGAQSGGGSSGGGGAWGTGGTNGTAPATTDGTGATSTSQPPATPTTSTGTTSTATVTKTAGPITNLRATNVTKTSFTVSWKAAANASQGYSYVVRDLASHTQTSAGKTNNTSVTVSGLKSGVDYNFGIQALPGGIGDNIHVRTK